ncbi:hypothetical protein KP509_31G044500 [Ceratopteris richardii]|uniref:Uncharacterized protein n=1 Tax=Ceratopteris richardii TaxID=49495 RepID=A0A8T2QZ04_CERRI|nr:hypothetical protein KP509_31G044500 [Ceratopteris richardii]
MGYRTYVKSCAIILTVSKDVSQCLLLSGSKFSINNDIRQYATLSPAWTLHHEQGNLTMHRQGQRTVMQNQLDARIQTQVSHRQDVNRSSLHAPYVNGYRPTLKPRGILMCSPLVQVLRGIAIRDNKQTGGEIMWACRCLNTVAEQTGTCTDSKQEVDASVWADLESKMQVLRGGLAKGEALEALKSTVDQLLPFVEPDDFSVGEACLALAQSFACLDEESPKFIGYTQRALRAYESHKDSPDYPRCLYLLGYAYFRLEEYDNAVAHLEQCISALKHLTEIGSDNDYCHGLEPEVHAFLGRSKMLLSKHSEAAAHFQSFCKLKEKLLEPSDPELAASYLQAARGFRGLKDVDGASSAALKALDIYTKAFGPTSLEVAEVRSFLCGLYCDMGKYKDSLAEADTARPILQQAGDVEEVAYLDFSIAESLEQMGRHDESVAKLEEVIKSSELTSAIHFNALLTAARACARTKKNECVTTYCIKAQEALRNREPSGDTALCLALLALVYEEQRECSKAIDILKQAKSMLEGLGISPEEIPAFAAADIDGKIGFLLLRVGKANDALPYLQNSLSKKKTFHSRELLYLHFNLGAAYIQLRRFQEAPQQLDIARKYLCGTSIGLDASKRATMFHNLASLYKSCRRYRRVSRM